ncbi:MAG: UbiD family decarboxylase, partial [Marinicaulis sp.]|nr:UbiD family decarboxylase [Marinicaulis sp.]
MSYRSLREFVDRLEVIGDLVRVSEPVSVNLEMTEIQTRLLAEAGPAVLFEKPVMDDGSISPSPVLVNLFGAVRRVAMGVTMGDKERRTAGELREVGELMAILRQPDPPDGIADALKLAPLIKTVMSMKPSTKSRGTAPSQQIVKTGAEINLDA